MSQKMPTTGGPIESNCSRCEGVTNHIVVAMVGEKVVRVECNCCGTTHAFRAPKQPKATTPRKAAAPRKTAAKKAAKDEVAWQQEVAVLDPGKAVVYAMDAVLGKGQLVSHPTFGLGLVTEIIVPNKAQILFESGRKLLRCALSS
ncbi:hypothetical protein [Geothermobacter hydrogeniphilus]|uniref:Uncharacterized protein n=1 Tax=Geothermobacter hydrogeniphilus TaxID=1969733 RepID=A0A1X0XIC4_9BACT|nr:hypothetical protein [Geothermobacter hydrogeniphilus]ORJ52636.1 hypothetical protein B5V00_16725 [Geothermobacter hydrogeniphilus]